MYKLVYSNAQGQLHVVTPVDKAQIEKNLGMEIGSMAQEDYEQHVWARSIPSDAVNPQKVDANIVDGVSREFRNAWIYSNGKIDHDLDKVKSIQLAKIRAARDAKLAALDGPYMKALEKDDKATMATIAAQKQALRDLTEPLKAMKLSSVDDAIAAFPAQLKD